MKQYVVTGRVFDIPANVRVELTPEQYKNRRHAVRPVSPLPEKWEKAVFETTQKIEFKQSEHLGTDLEVGKSQMVEVIPVKEGSDPALVAETVKKAEDAKGEKKKKEQSTEDRIKAKAAK
jgi:hypothetical protein